MKLLILLVLISLLWHTAMGYAALSFLLHLIHRPASAMLDQIRSSLPQLHIRIPQVRNVTQ